MADESRQVVEKIIVRELADNRWVYYPPASAHSSERLAQLVAKIEKMKEERVIRAYVVSARDVYVTFGKAMDATTVRRPQGGHEAHRRILDAIRSIYGLGEDVGTTVLIREADSIGQPSHLGVVG